MYHLNEGFSHTPIHSPSTTAAFPAIHCRCGTAFPAEPLLRAFSTALSLRNPSTTAAFPAIHCRCGAHPRMVPCHRLTHLPKVRRFPAFPAHLPKVRRCSTAPEPRAAAFSFPQYLFHLPEVRQFSAFPAHLPKVRRCSTASRTPCSRVSSSTVPAPPSEGGPSLDFIGERVILYHHVIQRFINQLTPESCLKGRYGSR